MNLRTVESLITSVAVVTEDDFEALVIMGPGVEGVMSSTRIKHHRIAQLAAVGMSANEMADLVGYSSSYVGTLLKSPAVQGLIQSYLEQGWNEIEAVVNRARAAASSGVAEIHRRILSTPETIPTKELTQATLGLLDRGGITQKHAVLHFGLSRDDVQKIVQGAAQDTGSRVVEVFAEDQDPDSLDGDEGDGTLPELRLREIGPGSQV